MRSSLVIPAGVLASAVLSISLFFLGGLEKAQSLIVGLLGVGVTLHLEGLRSVRLTRCQILAAVSLDPSLARTEAMRRTFEDLLRYYRAALFRHPILSGRAEVALQEFVEIITAIRDGHVVVEPKGRWSFGPSGLAYARDHIDAVSMATMKSYWADTWGEHYHGANLEAVRRGVLIRRIFVGTSSELQRLRPVMEKQAAGGICVLAAEDTAVPSELRDDYLIMDSAFLVRLDLGPDGKPRAEHISVLPAEIAAAEDRYRRLALLALPLPTPNVDA